MSAPPTPAELRAHLEDGEAVAWWARPIRPALGNWLWAIMALGVAFGGASVSALVDALTAPTLALGALVIGALLLAFSLLLLLLPLLAWRGLRRSVVAVTDRGVLHVRGDKARRYAPGEITTPQLVRRRGKSASLVLSEQVREKSDGTPVYQWTALHGLPDAEAALEAVRALKAARGSR